jgi:hypothetical protein
MNLDTWLGDVSLCSFGLGKPQGEFTATLPAMLTLALGGQQAKAVLSFVSS